MKQIIKSNKKLVVFGVLLESKMGGFKDILTILGKENEVKKIDEEYQKRKFFGPWGMEELAKLYKGFAKEELEKIALRYCAKNLMQGTRKCVEELKRRGFLIGALSGDPQFIMDALAKILPLDFSEGTILEFKQGIATGKIKRKVDRYVKAKILGRKIKKYGLKKENVIIIGDSITDLPMVKEAGVFIGFNIKEEIVGDIAKIVLKNKNLRKIFRYLPL